jgi:hypothetical protein
MQSEILNLLKKEGNKGADKAALMCISKPSVISKLLPLLEQNDKLLKNALIKTFSIVSKKSPGSLYNHFPFFSDQMLSNDKIIQWNAIDIVANMAVVDEMDYFDQSLLQRFLILLEDDSMITASHSVESLWKIAKSKRWTQNTIAEHLIKIDKIKRNPECANILTGKAIQTFSRILPEMQNKNQILGFVERQLTNPRPATAKKAELFMNRYLRIK